MKITNIIRNTSLMILVALLLSGCYIRTGERDYSEPGEYHGDHGRHEYEEHHEYRGNENRYYQDQHHHQDDDDL